MSTTAHKKKLEGNLRRGLDDSRATRDIAGDYPEPGDLDLRADCARDLRRFCDAYFPNAFNLPWSDDHLRAISRMEAVVLEGGLFALAMPRGAGKTTLSVRAAIWALLYGHRRFVCLIAATEDLAGKLLRQIKTELTFNADLARDFRQVCYPLIRLENNARKAIGQLFDGEQTRIQWTDNGLAFPTMPDSACDGPNVSGSVVTVAGLTGAIRGQSHTLASGVVIRPEVVILDDPQTRESASSLKQSIDRAAIVAGDVLGMAGPGMEIAAIMPCTVIREGDMASELLDRDKNPEWSGQRTKMVRAFPADLKLWDEYWRIRAEGLKSERGVTDATEFYRANRAAMDEGAVVAWPERLGPRDLSAVQHAMNLRFRNERAFFAEYQNEPLPDQEPRADDLTADQIGAKLSRVPRGRVPSACHRVTAFIDVQGSLLYYLVAAWTDDFTGYVIDYGSFPDQKRPYFTLADAKHRLAGVIRGAGLEGQIHGGLEALTGALLARDWPRDDGADLKIERLLIDANWAASTEVVRQFCRRSPHAALLTPSHGRGIGAGSLAMAEWSPKPGEKAGHNWRLRASDRGKGVRSVVYDTNYWKSFVHARLATATGDRGCLSLFGAEPEAHRMLADHLTSEFRVRTSGRGREVDEWRIKPERPDNHWFDCVTGATVAASMQGVALAETRSAAPVRARRRLTMDEMRRRGQAGA